MAAFFGCMFWMAVSVSSITMAYCYLRWKMDRDRDGRQRAVSASLQIVQSVTTNNAYAPMGVSVLDFEEAAALMGCEVHVDMIGYMD